MFSIYQMITILGYNVFMSETQPNSLERRELLDDNARKFILDGLSAVFLDEYDATSFALTTDWLKTDEDSEEKLVYKQFSNGDVQTLLIRKVTSNGNRTSVKEKITEEKYRELKASSKLQVEKNRSEFSYPQGDVMLSMKYDEFIDSKLRVLEVDAAIDTERNLFVTNEFPVRLIEVTGNLSYYGYRVASNLG